MKTKYQAQKHSRRCHHFIWVLSSLIFLLSHPQAFARTALVIGSSDYRPERDSAVYYYRETLKLGPVNLDAHEGLQRITQRYINLAEREMSFNIPVRAQQFITRGVNVRPTNIRLQDLRLRTEEMKIQQLSRHLIPSHRSR